MKLRTSANSRRYKKYLPNAIYFSEVISEDKDTIRIKVLDIGSTLKTSNIKGKILTIDK